MTLEAIAVTEARATGTQLRRICGLSRLNARGVRALDFFR